MKYLLVVLCLVFFTSCVGLFPAWGENELDSMGKDLANIAVSINTPDVEPAQKIVDPESLPIYVLINGQVYQVPAGMWMTEKHFLQIKKKYDRENEPDPPRLNEEGKKVRG